MVMYNNYQPLRSWLQKVKNKETIKSMSNSQSKKIRNGNTFMVFGANGYLGWSTICQLVYKFKNCNIIAVDNFFDSKKSITTYYNFFERVKVLKEYFDFSIEIENIDIRNCSSIIKKYNPDFIINLADESVNLNGLLDNSHLIVSTNYNSKNNFNSIGGKVTELKTANVIGLCNFITLIDLRLTPYNDPKKFLNQVIYDAVTKNHVKFYSGYFPVISLEDFTRSIVKIIRKGQKEQYDCFYTIEKNILRQNVLEIIKNTLKNFDLKIKISIIGNRNNQVEVKEKRKFLKLIDKHRPPVDYLISYSCKNFLDGRR